MVWGTVVVLASVLFAGCGGSRLAGPAEHSDRFTPTACPFDVPEGMRVDCGHLAVPEHRDRPNPRTIRLAVAVVHSPDQAPRPDPVMLLTGGPGGHALEMATGTAPPPARDLVIFNQRGVGHSQPALDCADRDPPVDLACRDRLLARGVDLTAYTTGRTPPTWRTCGGR